MTNTPTEDQKKKKIFSTTKFKRRYFELLLSSAVISSVIYLMNMVGFLVNHMSLYVVTLIGTVLFLIYNIKRCIASRSRLKGKKAYYVTNFAAYFAFMFTGAIIYLGVVYFSGTFKLIAKELYTFIFAIAKLPKLIDSDIKMRYSFLLFHSLGILCIFAGRIKSSNVAPKRKKVPAKRKRHSHHGHHSSHSHHSHHGHHSSHSHHSHHGHHDSNS